MSADVVHSVEVDAFKNLLRAHAAMTRALDRELVTSFGLTINDYEVLIYLSRAPNRMLRRVDLAQQVLLTPSGVTRLLDGLQRSRLVEKASCESDARVVYAKLTDEGARRIDEASGAHLESIRALFAERLEPEEIETLRLLLGRLPSGPSVC
ncbi:MAG: MarR family winged helix-turn-helix transcriptional regulator [Gaiellaceae bacterium]